MGLCRLVETYEKAEKLARENHIPSIVHVIDMTQQQVTQLLDHMNVTRAKKDYNGNKTMIV